MGKDEKHQGKKRKKSYYVQAAKRQKGRTLEAGMCGFFLTCNKRERECVREAYSLLNEYAQELYGPEKISGHEARDTDDGGSSSDEDDIEKSLKKEVAAIKDQQKSKDRRFQAVTSGANNCVFIRTTLPNPAELAHAVFSDIYENQKLKSRHIMRFLPVSGTCKPNEASLEKLAMSVFESVFKDEPKSYSIAVKIRNNNSINRDIILSVLGRVIKGLNIKNKVDLQTPEYYISVDVIRAVCCLSVVKDFIKFRKYNLQEAAIAKAQTTVKKDENMSTDTADKECDSDECDDKDVEQKDTTEDKNKSQMKSIDDIEATVEKQNRLSGEIVSELNAKHDPVEKSQVEESIVVEDENKESKTENAHENEGMAENKSESNGDNEES